MGHVAGYSTEIQVNLYAHYENITTPTAFSGLSTVATSANRIPDVSEIAAIGGTPDVRTFIVFGSPNKKKVAGPQEPVDFEFTVTSDFSKSAHSTLAGKKPGDKIAIAVLLTEAGEATASLHNPSNAEAWFVQGTISHVQKMTPTGGQGTIVCGIAISDGPLYFTK